MTTTTYLASARQTIQTERQALDVLYAELDHRFELACELILACTGRVVITGMGKSGHIGRKIAATFASTGTPSFFMHPSEAAHGDLGMLVRGDVLIAISNSGQSDEIMMLIPVVQHYAIPLISISQHAKGALPKQATVALTLGNLREACPLGLAPTSSTTATLALGDALAVALLNARSFTKDDFALSHPAGSLGKRLLVRVAQIMHTDSALPSVQRHCTIRETLLEITAKRLGITAVVSDDGYLVGVFTDGDLRRYLATHSDLTATVSDFMTKNPVKIDLSTDMLAADALKIMHEMYINNLIVVDDDNKPVGALHMHDILEAGVG
ncbi:MAG: KpsF/GutQ family sugar-phosphate isomerase [Moraxellaceae bacterium]